MSIIHVSGPSGSGKTCLGNKLKEYFKSKIIEWAQKEKKEFRFETLTDGATSEDKQYCIQLLLNDKSLGKAQHYSKKRAEQLVSELACTELGI